MKLKQREVEQRERLKDETKKQKGKRPRLESEEYKDRVSNSRSDDVKIYKATCKNWESGLAASTHHCKVRYKKREGQQDNRQPTFEEFV